MYKVEAGRIQVNSEYRYHDGVARDRYRVMAFATDGVTGQEKVVYAGIDGRDSGSTFVCSLSNFTSRFDLIPPQEEKTVVLASGKGY